MYGLIAAAAIVVGGGGIYFATRSSASAIPDGPPALPPIVITARDIVRGDPKAPVTLVEYASMTCPHCARWQSEVMPKLYETYIKTGKVRYVFREFPLDGAARMASALARCKKGESFYAFIDVLFKNQEQWIRDANGDGQITKDDIDQTLVQMGRVAGLNEQQVKSCVNSMQNLATVDQNWQEAQTTYSVDQTPTFVLNSRLHVGEWKWEELDAAVKDMLAQH